MLSVGHRRSRSKQPERVHIHVHTRTTYIHTTPVAPPHARAPQQLPRHQPAVGVVEAQTTLRSFAPRPQLARLRHHHVVISAGNRAHLGPPKHLLRPHQLRQQPAVGVAQAQLAAEVAAAGSRVPRRPSPIVCQRPQDTITTRDPANIACGTRVSRCRGCTSELAVLASVPALQCTVPKEGARSSDVARNEFANPV